MHDHRQTVSNSIRRMARPALLAGAVLTTLLAVTGPLASAAHHDFEPHAFTHLLLGMLAPLLLCLSAPITFAFRTLPRSAGRRLSRLLRPKPARVLTEPAIAATLNVGALWLLYTTTLFAAMHANALVHVLVHLHMAVTGYLFTISIISADPLPHRRSYPHRAAVLVVAIAAHDIMAKIIYASPPIGVPTDQAHAGAMIMYYGGDAVSIVILIIFCARWVRDPRHSPVRGVVHAGTP
jgi:putative membrane protein